MISWLSFAQDIRSPNLSKREFIPTLIFLIERGPSAAQGKYSSTEEPQTMNHLLRCNCDKLKGILQPTKDINRCVCYCGDCQAFARFLKREHDILDEIGGTIILQTVPKYVSFVEGTENLACIRLTENGLLRWYATCCNTPIGNTPPNFKLSFIGLIHNCLSGEPASLDTTFGPIRMYVSTHEAIGEPKPKSMGSLSGMLRVIGMVLRARLDGSYKQNPFFVSASGVPIVTPKVLNHEER
jgi:hypothetical protein